MHIRVAERHDIETLFDIRTSVVENYQSREEIATLGITPDSVADMLQTNCKAWIVELDGQAIGFSIANKDEATILGLFVRPQFEGRGAGRHLMAVAEDWLRSHGVSEAWLLTGNDPELRAYGFYSHLGWMAAGVETDGAFSGEMRFIKRL
ncbi:MAG: GNAT family N-acetyltransferase [Cyanobacteria bacterium P01_A01_bin.3]